jgi:hypothetical protein
MNALSHKSYEERVFSENIKYLAVALVVAALLFACFGTARAQTQLNVQTKAYPPGWSSDLAVSYKAINGYHPEGWTDMKGNVHIVWDDNEDDIYYAQVDESGAMVVSQKPLTQLSYKDGKKSNYPSIASDRYGDLWIFWQDNRSGIFEIYFTRSTDNGRTWAQEQRLTAEDGMQSQHPRASAKFYGESGRVYVTWQDRRGGNFETFVRMISYDNSGTVDFGYDNQVTPTDGWESTRPDIHCYKDWIYIAWNDLRNGVNEVYFKKSNDMGKTFSAEIPISDNDGFPSERPRLWANQTGLSIVWHDLRENNFEVYYKMLEHNLITTKTLVNTKRLSKKDIYDSMNPSVICDDKTIYVAWEDAADGEKKEIYYSSSSDQGKTFTATVILTGYASFGFSESSEYPKIMTHNQNVHVVWARKYSNNYDIFYKGTIVKLIATTPTANSTTAAINTDIIMEFSKMMNAATLQNAISVLGEQELVAGVLSFLNFDSATGTVSRIKFTPAKPLAASRTYTVRVAGTAKDKTGNAMVGNVMGGFDGIGENDFIWSFGTGSASRPKSLLRNIVNSPNPFNYITNPPGTYFNYSIDTEQTIGEVVIKIYSMSGRLIRTLGMASSMKGLNQQYWDGLDESGNRLANGVYLYKIHADIGSDEFVARGKMIVMNERNLN